MKLIDCGWVQHYCLKFCFGIFLKIKKKVNYTLRFRGFVLLTYEYVRVLAVLFKFTDDAMQAPCWTRYSWRRMFFLFNVKVFSKCGRGFEKLFSKLMLCRCSRVRPQFHFLTNCSFFSPKLFKAILQKDDTGRPVRYTAVMFTFGVRVIDAVWPQANFS